VRISSIMVHIVVFWAVALHVYVVYVVLQGVRKIINPAGVPK
jgi:hypothetical protein